VYKRQHLAPVCLPAGSWMSHSYEEFVAMYFSAFLDEMTFHIREMHSKQSIAVFVLLTQLLFGSLQMTAVTRKVLLFPPD